MQPFAIWQEGNITIGQLSLDPAGVCGQPGTCFAGGFSRPSASKATKATLIGAGELSLRPPALPVALKFWPHSLVRRLGR